MSFLIKKFMNTKKNFNWPSHTCTAPLCHHGEQGPNQQRIQDLVKGWGQQIFLRFYRCSEAALTQQSEPILARVQAPSQGPGNSCSFNCQICIPLHFLVLFFKILNHICAGILQNISFQNSAHLHLCIFLLFI